MDNVTHTLAGLLMAEVVVQHRGGRDALPARWTKWAYLASALSNNLPDADIVYVGITGGKIGYLAHHRGHTHTIGFALAVALATWLAVWLAGRRQGPDEEDASWSVADRRWLAFLAVIGPLVHLAMDGANNYGVHPFWPLDNHWYYGDTMFIIEPLLWGGIAPVLAAAVTPRWGKGLLLAIAAAGLVLSWVTGFVPWPLALFLTLWTLAIAAAAWRASPRRRAALGVGAALIVYATFLGTSGRARQELTAAFTRRFPDERLVDAAITPMPANPLCWSATTWSLEGDTVVARRGSVTPLRLAAHEDVCPDARGDDSTAPFEPLPEQEREEGSVMWRDAMRQPLANLKRLWSDSCHARAFLRWSRLPFHAELDGQEVIGDLRYDREASLGFGEVALPDGRASCPSFVPGWIPPRRAVLVP